MPGTGSGDPNASAALQDNPSVQGNGGLASGSPITASGSPGGQSASGTPPAAIGNRTPTPVIFVDPLTGKQTSPPPPAGADDQPSEPAPQDTDPSKPPRTRVIVGSGGSGQPADPAEAAANRFAPPVAPVHQPPAARKPAALRPAWVHGGRDWIIYVECRADTLVLYPAQRQFSLTQVTGDPANNPLVQSIGQMIAHRQSLRRPNEPPYRPQVCLLVRPENVRTFLRVYRDLGALNVPLTRRNLDADDDVISIVTGSNP
jgi:hypothetical protein